MANTFHEGDYISLDGTTGKIYKGDIKTVEASVGGDRTDVLRLQLLIFWKAVRTYKRADTPADTLNR